ncbi:hypothetical protein OSB04_001950 [Centaurea solstitialis]|uniref:Uncharacterized protein n=1 Tax=Centaurea solstitialis TaxID=347529 RepID=A0AA38WUN5_9ASTR|nr:hypothetical protein OSB04_001950 [Centaurea solstitialis]
MEFVGLKDLRVDNDSLAIKVRVCRLWESQNSKKNGEVITLDIVIIDDKQSLMTATIRKNLIDRFNNLLKESVVYIIQNFKVVPNSSDFRVTDSAFKILFTLITKLKKIDDHPSIPMHGFRFVGQKIIDDRPAYVFHSCNFVFVPDIAGRLTVVGVVETVTGGFRKRDLEFVSDSSKTCKVTLWGELGESFPYEDISKNESDPTIIIITSTQVKKFQGVINFATSKASKVYINLKNDYVSTLAERFAHICPRVTFLDESFATKKSLDDQMFENRMDIQQLLMAESVKETKGHPITILGVIDTIETQHGWFYMGCKACCRKVAPVDGIYTCRPPCNLESKNALTLYKIHLRVRDETGTISCVVLQKVAERLVDSSALKLLNKSDPNSNEFPSEITALCGQKFVFRLSLSEYNINHGSDAFTVNKVFEPDYTLEKKYKDTVEVKKLTLKTSEF